MGISKNEFSEKFVHLARALLPMPFTIAVGLTVLTFFLAWFFTLPSGVSMPDYALQLGVFWEKGLWNGGLMIFALQMMLMLVLGHSLALTPAASALIKTITKQCTNTHRAAALTALFSVAVGLFNWGLSLVFGAILARKIGEHANLRGYSINYPLVAAMGYSGLMVWHGGFSGSAPLKVNEPGHFLEAQMGIVSIAETLFSPMNLTVSVLVLALLPGLGWALGKWFSGSSVLPEISATRSESTVSPIGAEKADRSPFGGLLFGGLILAYLLWKSFWLELPGANPVVRLAGLITPNFINLTLLGLGLVLHRSFAGFISAVDEAISGAAGILIQFPLYFGIMGLMNDSGLLSLISQAITGLASASSLPLFTFFSAGLVNIFVPSGGGQWAVQGPMIAETANLLGASLPKCIMAMAYGDQLTNMLQPFWALPLLGITGLAAKDILPFTLFLFLAGLFIFALVLLIF